MTIILVTGSHGQLGSELHRITTNYPDFLFIFTDIHELNITIPEELDTFFKVYHPDYVINCAAYTAVDKAETEKEAASLVNIKATSFLAETCARYNALLIHISSDYVFNGEQFTPYKESDPTNPIGYYAISKLEGEIEIIKKTYKSLIIRTSWLYSEFGNNFVKTILRVSKEKEELKVVFDQIGTPTYAADLAKAILEIIPQCATIQDHQLFHYSNEGAISWYDFAKAITELSAINCRILPIETKEYPTPAKRPHYSVLNKSKIKSTFKISIPYWRDSLKICLSRLNGA